MYKTMYLLLFRAITSALDAIGSRNYGIAEKILCRAQQEAEQIFLEACDAETPADD